MWLASKVVGVAATIGYISVGCFTVSHAAAETAVERGAYLVTTIGSCGTCHSPKDATGNVLPGMELSGGFAFDLPLGHIVSPNITPDPQTGIGGWTEAQIVTTLREGKRPDGTIIGPPMPIPVYRLLSDHDVAAIAAYLHNLPPIRHAVARSQYKIPLPVSYGPPVSHVDEPVPHNKVGYGGYLATFGHCVVCHTVIGAGGSLDMAHAYAGGRQLPDIGNPGELTTSRNITSDPEQGIGNWTDEQIKRAIITGIRPDGTRLNRTMPSEWFAGMVPADVDALVAFLRTVAPKRSP